MNNTDENKIHIRHLGPISDSTFVKKYEDFFDYAFKESEIHNIAITAPRGAGKSSVLKTYLKNKGKSNDVLNISVGAFEKNEIDDNNTIKTGEPSKKHLQNIGQEIEMKILNQIIQQIDPKTIPESRFHIDREYNSKKTNILAALVGMAFICIIYLILFSNYDRESVFVNFETNDFAQKVINFLYNPVTLIVVVFILTIIIFFGVIVFFKNYTNKRIPKVTVKDCSLDPIDNNEDTMFNRYLDEILYMLIHSGYKTLVFEDLDRLNDYTIWEKLREINIILNKRIAICRKRKETEVQRKNKQNCFLKIKDFLHYKIQSKKSPINETEDQPIKFIYVMNDSVFKSKDRVKFFDYIIPIIPVVDKSNSMDKMMEISQGYFEISQAFLGSVSDYIDDMRLIYNIFNEMSIYKSQLGKNTEYGDKLDDNKLFAFVLYKNILPQDYEKFQYYDGLVYEVLNSFENMRQKELEKYKNDVIMRQKLLYAKPDDYAHFYDKKSEELYKDMTKSVTQEINKWAEEEKGLIKYLIMSGYLTIEDTQYVSYFYQTNMNNEERDFVLKIKRNQPVDVNQSLEHVNFVAKSLGRYIEYGNILNCDLVYYIMQNDNAHENNIYELIKSNEDYNFIEAFIKYLKIKDQNKLHIFIDKLNTTWDQVFYKMVDKSSDDLCLTYAQLSLCYSGINIIRNINYDDCLTKYLNTVTSLRSE